MKKIGILAITFITAISFAASDVQLERFIENLISEMRLEEKVSLCHGGSHFTTASVDRLNIPQIEMTDGPHGVRNINENHTYFPTGISMASTWNKSLIEQAGKAIGSATKSSGRDVILGPAICIQRNPLCGRFFEYMSEDPFLAGKLAVPYIKGVQSVGVAACAKHFVVNSQEYERFTISESLDERTLHEIYLPAFKNAVVDGGVWTVMSAYNKVNGIYCAENKYLLTDILKGQWGFDGAVISDWGGVHSTIPTATNGLDIEMPGKDDNYLAKPLLDACKLGIVSEEQIDLMVKRILRLKYRVGAIGDKQMPNQLPYNLEQSQKLAYEIATESITLLKNSHNLLPLKKGNVKSIFVTGYNAERLHADGGGSSKIHCDYEVSPLEGLKKACGENFKINYYKSALTVDFETISAEYLRNDLNPKMNGLKGEYFDTIDFAGKPVITRVDSVVDFKWSNDAPAENLPADKFSVRWSGKLIAPSSDVYVLALASDDGSRLYVDGKLVIDNWGNHSNTLVSNQLPLEKGKEYDIKIEYYDNSMTATVQLLWAIQPDADKSIKMAARMAADSDVAIVFAGLDHSFDTEGRDKKDMDLPFRQVEQIKAISANNKNTIVVLINGSPLDITGFIDQVPVVIEAWYAGQHSGDAIADIMLGDVNPSGKLPVTLPKKLADTPAFAIGDYPGYKESVFHREGIFVGYRYFDTMNVQPEFAFGHGLSYTSFEYSNPQIKSGKNFNAFISIQITNTGKVAGKETVQLYVGDLESSLKRPLKELKGFEKISLQPGETKTIEFVLDKSDFSFYDPDQSKWIAEHGEFEIFIGSSSKDIRVRKIIEF